MDDHAPRRSRIPTFDTWEEEAEFWDTHDTTEFEDEWEPVEIEVAHPLRHGLTVTFVGEEFHRLLAEAKRRKLGPSVLAHEWVMEALARAEAARTEEPTGQALADD
jgi:hypothetical protein